MKNQLLAAFAASIVATNAGVISFSSAFTDDASTGISSSNTYTHAIAGGESSTVNGVIFSALTPTSTPTDFAWTVAGGTDTTKNSLADSLSTTWVPATGGVTGLGAIDLLSSFTYYGGGSNVGASQTFSLTNLMIGETYDTRLYIRPWVLNDVRKITLDYTHGAETNSLTFDEDLPVNVIGGTNTHAAYYINYQFTAQATTLDIKAAVPTNAPTDSGSFHLYGLTNQVVPEPSSAALVMGLGLLGLVRRRY